MNNSYDKIAKIAAGLYEVSLELKDIDLDMSLEYLRQAKDFMDIVPEDKAYFPDEEKNLFKQLLED